MYAQDQFIGISGFCMHVVFTISYVVYVYKSILPYIDSRDYYQASRYIYFDGCYDLRCSYFHIVSDNITEGEEYFSIGLQKIDYLDKRIVVSDAIVRVIIQDMGECENLTCMHEYCMVHALYV